MKNIQQELKQELKGENINLRKFSIFRGLSPSDFDRLQQDMVCNLYKRGAIVYNEGSKVNGTYVVCSGILKIYKTGFDGKEQIIRFGKEGDLIAFRSVISNELACTTARVVHDATLCYITSEALMVLLKSNTEFSMSLMKLTCQELAESNKFLTDLAQKTVRERLAEILLILMDTFDLESDNTLKIALTREEIANMVGTATESVIRLLSEFRADKLIDLNGRRIRLLNIPKLIKIGNVYV